MLNENRNLGCLDDTENLSMNLYEFLSCHDLGQIQMPRKKGKELSVKLKIMV